MQYGSDNDDEEDKQAGGHAGVTAAEDDVSAQADAASAPQTEEERQALYQKHKEQVGQLLLHISMVNMISSHWCNLCTMSKHNRQVCDV